MELRKRAVLAVVVQWFYVTARADPEIDVVRQAAHQSCMRRDGVDAWPDNLPQWRMTHLDHRQILVVTRCDAISKPRTIGLDGECFRFAVGLPFRFGAVKAAGPIASDRDLHLADVGEQRVDIERRCRIESAGDHDRSAFALIIPVKPGWRKVLNGNTGNQP